MPFTITKTVKNSKIITYNPSDTITINNHRISFLANQHTDESYSIDIDQKILISTDNILVERRHDLAKYQVILCEIWDVKERTPFGHTSVEDLANIIQTFENPPKIIAIHQNPSMDDHMTLEYQKRLEKINVVFGTEHQVIYL
jgi:phosphoribosyl 1,2-cyclic phosphodiesterase